MALVVETNVSKTRLLLLEDDVVNANELKVKDFDGVLVVSVVVALHTWVVPRAHQSARVIAKAVHNRPCHLLVLVLGELVPCGSLKFRDAHTLYVACVGYIRKVGVRGKAVDKECWVYIVLNDSVVGVVAALGDGNTAGDEVFDIAPKNALVEVIPA